MRGTGRRLRVLGSRPGRVRPRLLDSFAAAHHPPLNLAALDTIAAFTDEGCIIDVIDHGIRTVHAHFDYGTGGVYNAPADVDYIERVRR